MSGSGHYICQCHWGFIWALLAVSLHVYFERLSYAGLMCLWKFNPRTYRKGGVERTPWYFANNSRQTRRIAAKVAVLSRWSIWHILWKFQVDVMSGHQVMTSYVRSCSWRNPQILRSVAQGCAFLLPSVWACIPWEFIGVYGCLDTIYSWLKVKVTQGHTSLGHLLDQFSRFN